MEQTKAFIDITDLINTFGCGISKAQALMRAIKANGDRLGIKGKVARTDYELWLNAGLNSQLEAKKEASPKPSAVN